MIEVGDPGQGIRKGGLTTLQIGFFPWNKFFKMDFGRAFIFTYCAITLIAITSEGNTFREVEEEARRRYDNLGQAFGNLLQCKVEWGVKAKHILPLYKVVFSNIHRLNLLGEEIREDEKILEACRMVEETAAEAIEALTQ